MPLTIIHPTGDEPMYIATSRLYVNRDYSRLVPEGSPEAAFLLATPGKPIPMDLAQRLGLLDPPAAPEPEAKMINGPPADKARRRRQTKALADPASDHILDRHPLPGTDADGDDDAGDLT